MSDPVLTGGIVADPVLGGNITDPVLGGDASDPRLDATIYGGQGPAGPAGPPADDLIFVATEPLSGHRAVYVRPDGSLAYASSDNPSGLDSFVGVTLGAAAANAPIVVRAAGEIDEPSWAWAIGPVWLGLDGQLTQADPGAAVTLLIGVAIGATRLFIIPEPAFQPA